MEKLDHLLARGGAWLDRRRKPLTAAFVTLLGGFAATAFGVAPLLPDPADLPQRQVVDDLRLADLSRQLDALAEHELELSRTELTRAGDTADSLLRRLGVADADAAAFLRRDAGARQLLDGKPGKMVQARARADGTVVDLVARYAAADGPQRQPQFTRLTVERVAGQWTSRVEVAPLAAQTRLASGTIRNTLFAATDEAGIPDSVASQLAEIFAADIDFHRELRKGDTFGVVYEVLSADGEPVSWMPSAGRVLSAEFVNGGRQYNAIWFADGTGRGAYFGLDGQSRKRSFLASPLEFSRVTSGFAMRFHPLLQSWRAHRGVDYGAPTGTPVRSVGDGRVDFAGWQNGYGNVVQVQHDNDRSTLYAHLSRIDVRKGQAVEQGQRIGAVGSTGWSTGPHLHFEFHVNGRHQDPSSLAKAAQPLTLDPKAKSQFAAVSQAAQAQLDLAETVGQTRSLFE
ncbi:MAG: M23 family metallopeptidase [Burkholderiales bacterium]|nr:M23 family metallopeptidase [Burkholderiales bacterium]